MQIGSPTSLPQPLGPGQLVRFLLSGNFCFHWNQYLGEWESFSQVPFRENLGGEGTAQVGVWGNHCVMGLASFWASLSSSEISVSPSLGCWWGWTEAKPVGWCRVGTPFQFKPAVLGGYRGGEDRLSFCPQEAYSLAGKKKKKLRPLKIWKAIIRHLNQAIKISVKVGRQMDIHLLIWTQS